MSVPFAQVVGPKKEALKVAEEELEVTMAALRAKQASPPDRFWSVYFDGLVASRLSGPVGTVLGKQRLTAGGLPVSQK